MQNLIARGYTPPTNLVCSHVPQTLQSHLLLLEASEGLLETVVGELLERMVKHPPPVVNTLAQRQQLRGERGLTFSKSYLK